MRRNKLSLHLHLVWATWDRLPLITSDIERRLHRNVQDEAHKQGCTILAVGGIEDHMHVLSIIPTTITIANLVKQLKGVSAHFVNETFRPDTLSKWQGGYGAFTVSRWDVEQLIQYILHQKEHHASNTLIRDYEDTFEEIETK